MGELDADLKIVWIRGEDGHHISGLKGETWGTRLFVTYRIWATRQYAVGTEI